MTGVPRYLSDIIHGALDMVARCWLLAAVGCAYLASVEEEEHG
jgi:hypothetical protein